MDDDYVLNNNLNRAKQNSSGFVQNNVMDVASFMGSIGVTSGLPYNTPGAHSVNRPQSAPKERRNSFSDSVSFNSGVSQSTLTLQQQQEKQLKVQKFKEFLARQKQSVMRKENHVDAECTYC